jgi:hypothetical protein
MGGHNYHLKHTSPVVKVLIENIVIRTTPITVTFNAPTILTRHTSTYCGNMWWFKE